MKSEIFLQANGQKLGLILAGIQYVSNVRIASAYVSATAATLLNRFPGVPKTLLIDYEPRLLTEALLRSLIAIPKAQVFVADIAELFHPKVYIIDTPSHVHFAVGSNNTTRGGLEQNVEVMVYAIFSRKRDSGLIANAEDLWAALTGIASTRVDSRLIASRKGELAKKLPPRKRTKHARRLTANSTSLLLTLPSTLYKVVRRETGAGGTQVQFPIDVVREYFGNDGVTNARFVVSYQGKNYAVQLTHQRHNMHRIVLPFLAGVPRPAVLRLKRAASGFVADVYTNKSSQYARVSKNGRRTRKGANRYLILP